MEVSVECHVPHTEFTTIPSTPETVWFSKQANKADTVSLLFTSEGPECLANLPHGTEVRLKPILV